MFTLGSNAVVKQLLANDISSQVLVRENPQRLLRISHAGENTALHMSSNQKHISKRVFLRLTHSVVAAAGHK